MPIETNDRLDDATRDGDPTADSTQDTISPPRPVGRVVRIAAYGLLPGLVLMSTLGVGYLKYQNGIQVQSDRAVLQSVPAASDSAVAMLSYRADSVEQDLTAASARLTGSFRDDYSKLINEVVIPGAKQKDISAVAAVRAAGAISATPDETEVLVLVDQTTTIGSGAPTDTASSVRMTMRHIDGKWLVSKFEPL